MTWLIYRLLLPHFKRLELLVELIAAVALMWCLYYLAVS